MRIGVLAPHVEAIGWDEWSRLIQDADHLGVDAVLLRKGARADPLLLAATLASTTTSLRVVAEVEVTRGLHPVHLAERIAVADQCLAGRLVVVLSRALNDEDPSLLIETLAVLELALASRPFSYVGAHWRIPALMAENVDANWSQLSVTPSPAQLQVPLWLSGADTQVFALQDGYVWLAEGEVLQIAAPSSSRGTKREPRPLVQDWIYSEDGFLSATATAQRIISEQRSHGVDLVFLPLLEKGVSELATLTSEVRPRIQLAELPQGIDEFWDSSLPADPLEP